MANFYRALGFIDENSKLEKGNYIEQVVHLENVEVEWIKMRAPDGNLIELLKYHSHPKKINNNIKKTNELGCSHIAFTVKNLDQICNLIKQKGGKFVNPPAISPDGKVKVIYCYDPEGGLIELVQEL